MKKNSRPNPNATGKIARFEIPESILKQLDEFSNGGFMLVTLDNDGEPQVHQKFDSSVHQIGIHKWSLNYLQAMDSVQAETMMDSIASSIGFEEEDNEED